MARVITGAYAAPQTAHLSRAQRRVAARRLTKQEARNPLRRIQLECDTRTRRDPSAVVGDHVWCDEHRDLARVVSVVE